MTASPVFIQFQPGSSSPAAYRVAGQTLYCSTGHPALAGFEIPLPKTLSVPQVCPPDWQGARTTFKGEAVLARGRWPVSCRWQDGSCRIEVDGLGQLDVHRPDLVSLRAATKQGSLEDLLLTAISPGAALCWAGQGPWLLHASAVQCRSGGVVVMGESGAGKSTLARAWDGRRVADDCVPVLPQESVMVGPFPQPKLKDYGGSMPERLRLAALVGLLRDPDSESATLEALSPAESLTLLVRHTVAGALLEPELMARQLADLRPLAEALPCYRLRYRPGESQIPRMMDLLEPL